MNNKNSIQVNVLEQFFLPRAEAVVLCCNDIIYSVLNTCKGIRMVFLARAEAVVLCWDDIIYSILNTCTDIRIDTAKYNTIPPGNTVS